MNLATHQERYLFVNFHGLRVTFPTSYICNTVIKNKGCCTCDMAVNDLSCTPCINIVSQIPLLLITLIITPNISPTYLHCFLAHQSQTLQVVHFAIWQYEITDGHEMTLERRLYMSYLDSQSLVL